MYLTNVLMLLAAQQLLICVVVCKNLQILSISQFSFSLTKAHAADVPFQAVLRVIFLYARLMKARNEHASDQLGP